jgi:hypothetical protein
VADSKATPRQRIFVTVPFDGMTWGTLRHFVELCSSIDDDASVEFEDDPHSYDTVAITATLDIGQV